MKIKILVSVLILFGVIGVTIHLGRTFKNSFWRGKEGHSPSIKESKERGVFIQEISLGSDNIAISTQDSVQIEAIWIEKKWRYGKEYAESVTLEDNFWICISLSEEIPKTYYKNWFLYLNGKNKHDPFSRSRRTLLSESFKGYNKNENLELFVCKGKGVGRKLTIDNIDVKKSYKLVPVNVKLSK